MITKIKDENGVEHLVQGAGTVYNEEHNSLAFGKGTSAIGQDQFVFGKYNIPDTDKAEIVGGGTEEEDAPSLQIGELIDSSFYPGHSRYRIWYAGTTIENLRECISLLYGTPISNIQLIEPRDMLNVDIDFVLLCTPSTNRLLYSVHSTDGNWYEADGYILYNDSVNFPSSEDIDTTKEITIVKPTRLGGYLTPYYTNIYNTYKPKPSILHKNIRTLDWSGNEVLKNSLDVNGVRIGNHPLHANSDYCISCGFDNTNTPRFGIKSDGTFCVKYNDEIIELTPAKLAALIQTLNQ